MNIFFSSEAFSGGHPELHWEYGGHHWFTYREKIHIWESPQFVWDLVLRRGTHINLDDWAIDKDVMSEDSLILFKMAYGNGIADELVKALEVKNREEKRWKI